ncbi:HET domain-containing protein [Fusarium falciforme]|uniref:HET domain-containing protein n=1 Tax=Fusarium falciforme TaxID=195108 RepID=UPI002300966F|nr:HET domain-containing protein [Fusarium falciforme]WAO95425.1 HET domain-containing protein [Fusarium falciforme]
MSTITSRLAFASVVSEAEGADIEDTYISLDSRQIRLLTLEPGKYGDEIVGHLEIVDLKDEPIFEALSYCWGDRTDVCEITVDEHKVCVTRNLYGALQRLRYETVTRQVWADAICINQEDDVEKAHQVNLMKDIFTRASGTTLFIGDYRDDATSSTPFSTEVEPETQAGVENAISLIRKLADDCHIFYLDFNTDASSLPDNSFQAWYKATESIRSLVTQPWWSRMWTVQEAVLPADPTVQYGAIKLSWMVFSQAVDNMFGHFQKRCCNMKVRNDLAEEPPIVTFYNKVSAVDRRREDPLPLNMLLGRFRDRKATDARDMIYGVLGLAHDEATTAGIEANYTIETVQLYARIARKLIQLHGDLRPFMQVYHFQGDRLHGLPSWVPDYSLGGDWEYYSVALLYVQNFWKPVDLTPFKPSAGDNPLELDVSGILFDDIIAVGDSVTPCPRKQIMDVFDKWVDLVRSLGYWSSRYPTQEGTYEDNMWMILCRGLIWLNSHDYRMATHEDRQLVEEEIPTIPDGRPVNIDLQLLYFQRFFITRNGYMGLASPNIQVGDTVHVLVGGNTPFIMRKPGQGLSDQSNHFSLVSAAFVHGIMQGGLLPKEEALESFTLV